MKKLVLLGILVLMLFGCTIPGYYHTVRYAFNFDGGLFSYYYTNKDGQTVFAIGDSNEIIEIDINENTVSEIEAGAFFQSPLTGTITVQLFIDSVLVDTDTTTIPDTIVYTNATLD